LSEFKYQNTKGERETVRLFQLSRQSWILTIAQGVKIAFFYSALIFWLALACSAQTPVQKEKRSPDSPERLQVAHWIDQLQSKDAKVSDNAAKALLKQSTNSWDQIAKAVWGAGMDATSTRALDAFVRQGSNAVPLMLGLIRREQTGLLRHNPGLSGLLKMGTNALPGLENGLQDPDPDVRGATISVLPIVAGAQETQIRSALLLIRVAKMEKDETLRVYAIDALGYFGLPLPTPDIVCDALRELLHDKLEKARATAAYSLAKACPASALEALPVIAKAVSSDDKELAWESAFALSFIGTNAVTVLPELIHAVDNADIRTADEIFRVIAKMGDPAFPAFQKAVTNSVREDLRLAALNGLGDFSASTKTNLSRTISLLSEMLKDPDRDIRYAAMNSLRRAAVESKDPKLRASVIEMLRPMLDDKDPWIPDDAKRALKEIEAITSGSR
jgi:HEAT repeat protein